MSASVLVNPELIFPPLQPADSRVVNAIEQIVTQVNTNTAAIATLDSGKADADLSAVTKLVVSGCFPGVPGDGAFMFGFAFPDTTDVLPQNLSGSIFKPCAVAPAAETILTLKKLTAAGASSDIGTLTYAQTTGACTVGFATAVTFALGDRLHIVNQADNDASAAGFYWTFVATRG